MAPIGVGEMSFRDDKEYEDQHTGEMSKMPGCQSCSCRGIGGIGETRRIHPQIRSFIFMYRRYQKVGQH